jgi:hypothetical protein
MATDSLTTHPRMHEALPWPITPTISAKIPLPVSMDAGLFAPRKSGDWWSSYPTEVRAGVHCLHMTQAIATDIEEITPASLWETLLYYIQCIVPMFGSAKAIAEKHTLNREEHFHLQGWLFRCEEFFRRMLFLDALNQLPETPEPKQRTEPIIQRETSRAPTLFDPEHPETWRVRFAIVSSVPTCGPQARSSARAETRPSLGPQISEWVIIREEPQVISVADLMRGAAPLGPPASPPARSSASQDAGEDADGPRALHEPKRVYDAYPLAKRIEALERATQDREHHVQRMARWLVRNVRQALRFTLPTLSRQRLKTRPGDVAVEDASRLCASAINDARRRNDSS